MFSLKLSSFNSIGSAVVIIAFNSLIVSESDSVVSVQEEREPMFNYGKSGLNLINPGRFKDLSFDKERLYRFNGSIIASLWENISRNDLFGIKT